MLIFNKNFLKLRCKFIRHFHKSNIICGSKTSEDNIKELLEKSALFQDVKPTSENDKWYTTPYPKNVNLRDQSQHSLKPRINPSETTIIMFPGQGTQFVGMGKELLKFPSIKDLFEIASQIVRQDVLKLCVEGPQNKLNRTDFQQIAIFLCSIAALERLKEEQPSVIENCYATAGFSLGEMAALVFSEALTFEEGLKLVKIRGESMQLAAELNPGAMLTVFLHPDSKLNEAFAKAKAHALEMGVENPYCGVSNYLFPECKIIAGHKEAIEFIETNKDNFKLKKVQRLPVSGAFHSPLMEPAIEPFKASLKKIQLKDPSIAVYSNIDGKVYRNAEHIRARLPKQILAPVKWEQTLHVLYERPKDVPFPRTFECGPGKSLSTILKQVNFKAYQSCFNIPA